MEPKPHTEKIQYLIEVPPDLAAPVAALLTGAGVDFHPMDNMIAVFKGDDSNTTYGNTVQETALAINAHLDEYHLTPRLRTDFHPKPHPQDYQTPRGQQQLLDAHSLLTLATTHFEWSNARIVNTYWETDPQTWKTIISDFPTLFAKNQENGTQHMNQDMDQGMDHHVEQAQDEGRDKNS